ncbi:hypothetical protein FRX31_034081 [Thalictrum thalictroides]|uniref:Uncharacterized protein n=1 Tax=Thalictrum thalictroides TaxID=46969 RepID=A0A7J6UUQ3_THATH|nr:hypothetical protein FRX31_034081 [Thalictrum thalictroides]
MIIFAFTMLCKLPCHNQVQLGKSPEIKDDFDDITAEEELLLEEVIIQQEDYNPKDYEQLFEENIELKAKIVKNDESEGASKHPKKLKLKLKLNRSQTPKENIEVGVEERREERVEVRQEEGQQETVVVPHKEEEQQETIEVVQDEVQQEKPKEIQVQKGKKRCSTRVRNKNKAAKCMKKKKVDEATIIKVDELDVEDKMEVAEPLKDVTKSKYFDVVEEEHQTKLKNFFYLANREDNAYEDDTYQIMGHAVENLMFDNFTDANVRAFVRPQLSCFLCTIRWKMFVGIRISLKAVVL